MSFQSSHHLWDVLSHLKNSKALLEIEEASVIQVIRDFRFPTQTPVMLNCLTKHILTFCSMSIPWIYCVLWIEDKSWSITVGSLLLAPWTNSKWHVDVTQWVPEMKCTRHYAYYGRLWQLVQLLQKLWAVFHASTIFGWNKTTVLDQEMVNHPTSQMFCSLSTFLCAFCVAGN